MRTKILMTLFLITLSGCSTLFKKAELVPMEGDLCSITISDQYYEYDNLFLGDKTYSYADRSQLTITQIKKENGKYDFKITYLSYDSGKDIPDTTKYVETFLPVKLVLYLLGKNIPYTTKYVATVSQVIDNNSFLAIDNSKVLKYTLISQGVETIYDGQGVYLSHYRSTIFDIETPYKYTTTLGARKTIPSYVIIDIPSPYFLLRQGGSLCIEGKPYKKVYK